jgi:hypothetical protein
MEMPEAGKDPHGDPEGRDTDEQFEDHPELAPSQGRMSVEKVKDLDEEARKRSLAGDAVEEAGDRQRKTDLDFVRNNDYGGNEGSLAGGEPDYSRGSGFIGGKLVGEGPSGEEDRIGTHEGGFQSSEKQARDLEAIHREEEGGAGDWSAHPSESESHDIQGRDYPKPSQKTGIQGFGRDLGSSGLGQEDREQDSFSQGRTQEPPNHKIWAAILKRLGGSSPGSEENLQLAGLFSRVQFPSDREGVFAKLAPGAEFRLREGIVVDLHQAVEHSRARSFRNIGDLVDCVKDELRRMEADGLKVLKMA